MRSHGRARRVVALACAWAFLALGCSGSGGAGDASPPSPGSPSSYLSITVNGEPKAAAEGETLGEALKSMGIRAQPGHLLDVSGEILERDAYPPKLTVNGKRADRETPLADGDTVVVISGRDHTEDTYEERERVDKPQQANPQSLLGAAPGWDVSTFGKESGKLESIVFEPDRLNPPKAVALTFDDGPNSTYTPKVLAILKKFNVPATFFVLGYLVDRYPQLVKDELAQGMVVGSHSWNHPHDFAALTPHKQTRQLQDSIAAIKSVGGDPYLFRPPEGSYDASVVELARREGLRTVMWAVDPHDYEDSATAKGITKSVLSHLRPGAIVLFHDGGGDQSATVKALPDVIKGIRKRGYDLVLIQP